MRVAKRRKLAVKRQMGCPNTKPPHYPLDTVKHIRSAMQYYGHKRTVKCKEFWNNWCRRAKIKGLTHYPTFSMKCTPKGKRRRR